MLGIDPGTRVAGYAVIVREGRSTTLVDYGAVVQRSTESLVTRIGVFAEQIEQLSVRWQVTDIALETPFLGKNAQNFLKLGYMRGVLYALAHRRSLALHEYAPAQIKQSIAGSGAADKAAIARVIARLFPGVDCGAHEDISDAIAISLCAVWRAPHQI